MSTKHKVFPKFYFEIDRNNKLIIKNREMYEQYRNANFRPGSKGYVVLKPYTRIRSSGQPGEKGDQNGYLHAVVLPMGADDRGYTVEEYKEACIQEFSPYKFYTSLLDGTKMKAKKRTHEMTTVEMMEFIENIRRMEAERGLIIPDPIKVDIE